MIKKITSRRADMSMTELMGILLALAFLVWLIFFNTSLGDAIKEAARSILRMGR